MKVEDVDKMSEFIETVVKVCKKPNMKYEFICTICGKKAYAIKDSEFGHCRAQCNHCGMSFIE